MSHWTDIKTQIKDLAALAAAVAELGCELNRPNVIGEKVMARGWGGRGRPCDALVRIPGGNYDVALDRQPDGTYSVSADYYDGSIEAKLGQGCKRMTQLYSVHKATAAARMKGYSVLRQQGPNNSINLVVSVP